MARRNPDTQNPNIQTGVVQEESASLENVVDRYDRQQRIEGWRQEALGSAKVAIIGNDVLANYTALTMAALGFGDIEIYGTGKIDDKIWENFHPKKNRGNNNSGNFEKPDYSTGFLYFESRKGQDKSGAIAEFIKKVNPFIKTQGVSISIGRSTTELEILGKPSVIIDTTNNPISKISAIEYGIKNQIPVVSMVSDEYSSAAGIYDPKSSMDATARKKLLENLLFIDYQGKKQGTTTSQVISAIGVDEARKYLMPIKNQRAQEKIIEDIVVYNLDSDKRFDWEADRSVKGYLNNANETSAADLSEKTVIMIGAGALGNFAGLDMVLNNIGTLYVVDFDEVESTNLNRQVFFYDSVGKKKAAALTEVLSKINPRCHLIDLPIKITPKEEGLFSSISPDLIVDGVDNNKARALLNYFATKHQIPFVSSGTKYDSGQTTVYYPGKTACLNCQAEIDDHALSAHQPNQSCIFAAQPSVITSNQIQSGIGGGETKTILLPQQYGEPTNYMLKYVSGEQFRVAALPTRQKCECHNNKERIDGWMEKMKHIYV